VGTDVEEKIRFRMPLLLGAAALLLLCWVAATRVRLVAQESTKTHEPVGPIPVAGPLAAPKSLSQVGVPVEATRAAVPADNPKIRRKLLSAKSFSATDVYRVMAPLLAARAMTRHVLSPTEGPFLSALRAARASAMLRRF
jgi:hypothetical protein